MPVLLVVLTLIVVALGWNSKDGMPASEKYRQKFIDDP